MTKYKCEHETDGIIILEDSILSMATYFQWSESVGVFGTREVCWDCWCKDHFKLKRGKNNE